MRPEGKVCPGRGNSYRLGLGKQSWWFCSPPLLAQWWPQWPVFLL